jgi:hypothetical protein
MHSYASDSLDRRIAPWAIAICAVGVAFLYDVISRSYKFSLPWWFETPSIMAVYGIFHWFYDRKLWKTSILGLPFSAIPNFNGTWFGELKSSHDGNTTVDGMLLIHQTWTKIVLEFRTEQSVSYSRMASLNINPGPSKGLIYEYTNDPRADAHDTMHAHRGLCFLELSKGGQWLDGEYYTGRDRSTVGKMRLKLLSRDHLDLQDARKKYSLLHKDTQ